MGAVIEAIRAQAHRRLRTDPPGDRRRFRPPRRPCRRAAGRREPFQRGDRSPRPSRASSRVARQRMVYRRAGRGTRRPGACAVGKGAGARRSGLKRDQRVPSASFSARARSPARKGFCSTGEPRSIVAQARIAVAGGEDRRHALAPQRIGHGEHRLAAQVDVQQRCIEAGFRPRQGRAPRPARGPGPPPCSPAPPACPRPASRSSAHLRRRGRVGRPRRMFGHLINSKRPPATGRQADAG